MKIKDIKNWNVEIEKQITSEWQKSDLFAFGKNTKKKIYSIDTPPPYVNAPIHMGHAVTYCYMDFFARYKRMKGFEVLFPLGLDRNGLPIEMGAEKKYKTSPFRLGREKFIELCEQMLAESSAESLNSFARLAISFSSYKEGDEVGSIYMTDSPTYRAVTQSTFIEMYKKKLVYEDTRINNWDPKLRTTVADSEVEYKEIASTFNDVKWAVSGGGEIVIATTRPELIGTCSAVIYHPDDKRYKKLEGKKAIIPIYGREVPIMAHPFADPSKGTGIVMMCAGGDLTDIAFVREQKLEGIIWIGQDGRMIEAAGVLAGLKVREAREKIARLLKEKDLIVKQEQITHRTPVSERSGAEIEFIEMPEYYLRQMEFLKDVKRIAKKINFYPAESKKILDSWIDSVSIDWPISRRRFYATPIPLWVAVSKEGNTLVALPKGGKYYVPWKEKAPKDCDVYQNGEKIGGMSGFKNLKWEGETRVLDTWMDSSISELFMLSYGKDKKFFDKAYPATLRPQGKEIVRTWLYYTLLRGFIETGKPAFEDVWIHQHVLDNKGKKMSKSAGNVIDPQVILRDYGSEALRIWSAIEGNLAKQDLKCSPEKIRAEMKTSNKLLNVAKFVMLFDRPRNKPKLCKIDELFIDYIEDLTSFAESSYDKYDFHAPMLKLREFLWEIFASHYIEIVKNRAYNEEKIFSEGESSAARWTLYYLLERMLRLMYPVIPQLTSVIGSDLGFDLLSDGFPKSKKGNCDLKLIDKIREFNSEVWKTKREKGISLRDGASGVNVPKALKDFEKDLVACHKLEQ